MNEKKPFDLAKHNEMYLKRGMIHAPDCICKKGTIGKVAGIVVDSSGSAPKEKIFGTSKTIKKRKPVDGIIAPRRSRAEIQDEVDEDFSSGRAMKPLFDPEPQEEDGDEKFL